MIILVLIVVFFWIVIATINRALTTTLGSLAFFGLLVYVFGPWLLVGAAAVVFALFWLARLENEL